MQKARTFLIAILFLLLAPVATAQEQAVVHAVLFYSPSCPHCHHVINDLLIPMTEEYGDQLQVAGIDVSHPKGQELYQAAIDYYEIPPDRLGVPTLIVTDTVLVGSGEIPDQFPGIVATGLESGGIPWPDMPGLEALISPDTEAEPEATASPETEPSPETAPSPTVTAAEAEPTATPPPPTNTPAPTPDQSVVAIGQGDISDAPPPDPVGATLAGIVLAGMGLALLFAAWRIVSNGSLSSGTVQLGWVAPVLVLLGLIVSGYLAYVEINQVEAVCGPVGHCNVVQASPYARLVGIPIAVLGLLFYLAVGIGWLVQRQAGGNLVMLGLVAITAVGTLFSIYLTLLEIFVIHAVCMWCLSSAVITTLLMLIVVNTATRQPTKQQRESGPPIPAS